MTAPQTPPLSAEDAREAALASMCTFEGPHGPGECAVCDAFRAGWKAWRPVFDWTVVPMTEDRAVEAAWERGLSAARAYARTLAKEAADGND